MARGVDTKIVSMRMGHATTAITQDLYQHVSEGIQADAIKKLGLIFSPSKTD